MTNEVTYFYKGAKDMKIGNSSVLIIRAYFRFFTIPFLYKRLHFIPNLHFLWVYIKWRHMIDNRQIDIHTVKKGAYIFLLVTSKFRLLVHS